MLWAVVRCMVACVAQPMAAAPTCVACHTHRVQRAVAAAAARHAEDRQGASMSPAAVLHMLRELSPGLSTAALRTVAVLLRRADAEDGGLVSLRATAQVRMCILIGCVVSNASDFDG